MDNYSVKHLIYLGWQIMAAHKALYEIYYDQFDEIPFGDDLLEQKALQTDYWESYFNFARGTKMTQFFEDPEQTGKEFERILKEIKLHQETLRSVRRAMDALLIIYRTEFLMIDSGLETLRYFGQLLRMKEGYDYQFYLNLLVKTSKREGRIPEALELLGEVLLSMYTRNHERVLLQYTDQLTKVLRRGYFMNLLFTRGEELKGREIGMMLIEVDYLQHSNMQYGYHEGDLLLQKVSGMIKDSLRFGDFVGRYSNKQFMVIIEDIDWDNLFLLGDKIRIRVRDELQEAYGTTVSIGAVLMPVEDDVHPSIIEMINEAEGRLYQVRTSGGGNILI